MTEDTDTKQAESQFATALMRLRSSTFTYDEVLACHLKSRSDGLKDLTGVFATYTARGYLHKDGDLYSLTEAGTVYRDTICGEDFGEVLLRADQSAAYGQFCALLYGKDLGQFSMTTMEQLGTLIEVLGLDEHSRVLDLGCGVGRITEYLSDVTGAHLTGLDFAGPAVRRAQERTRNKAGRLTFVLGSMNALALADARFDTIISLDTLYFATDLQRTVVLLQHILQRTGQMGIFWTQLLPAAEALDHLQPDNTRVARALTAAACTFQTYDFTVAEKEHWQRSLDLLEELKPAFEAEGSSALYELHLEETQSTLKSIRAGRISRYLYHVRT